MITPQEVDVKASKELCLTYGQFHVSQISKQLWNKLYFKQILSIDQTQTNNSPIQTMGALFNF
jgi:hypothetical protein